LQSARRPGTRFGRRDAFFHLDTIASPPLQLALPTLTAGHRFVLPRPPGSGDALLLAQLARRAHAARQLVVILCADALDAQRLTEELPWFDSQLAVCAFPDWETLPYDILSPHQDLVSERLAALYQLSQPERSGLDVLVVPATTALYLLPPASFVAARTFFFRQGDRLALDHLRSQLALAGYQHVSQVVAPGEFSVRGGLIDLFPMGAPLPYRLDLFDDAIETIRTFDPDTQRGLYPTPDVRILPGREFPFDDAARAAFRGRWREQFEGDPSRAPLYKDVGHGVPTAGIEYYLPLFFEGMATLFDYLPASTQIVLHGAVDASVGRFWTETSERFRFIGRDAQRPCLPPSHLFLDAEKFFAAAGRFARLALTEPNQPALGRGSGGAVENPATGDPADAAAPLSAARQDARGGHDRRTVDFTFAAPPALAIDRKAADPITRLRDFAHSFDGRVLVLADSPGRRETMAQLLRDFGMSFAESSNFDGFVAADAPLALAAAPLHSGFVLPEAGLALVTEAELYAASPRRARRRGRERASNVEALVRDLAELRIGDPVVHVEHGIGRYLGLAALAVGTSAGARSTSNKAEAPETAEFLQLQYANDTTLYVPVAQLHLIGRYSGADPDAAPLHQLGSGDWDRARKKAARQVRDTAAELLNLYALRAARKGHAFALTQRDYEAFAAGFPFDETADQQAAIDAVLRDMSAGAPMDRLVCGDVGFGKTEVALRAAFVAVAGGKQVAVLCPTTLLVEQHFATFRDRFAQIDATVGPVNIVELSRFRSPAEVRQAITGLNSGAIDIVIGTHKLLAEDVRFGRLGLVIIDEEHRFGVRQKERLKSLRAEVDVLTLTATPIPRTLAMSMEGIRDFSVIATAPQRRLAIKTFVRQESAGLVREAFLRELKRGGQIYFLHNEVETIANRRARLAELVPEARIEIAHGQMGERELERVMRDFYQQRFNVLLCTTIIETGIDVPTANTIVIHRADKFGLAQLHQLRGRVGRSHHQAYAYLLVPEEGGMTKNAAKRLDAIQTLDELGSGFYLAMHDLEIRGAGEVLGESQSGNLQEVGFDLYTQMLNAAVRALRSGREPNLLAPLAAVTEINLHVPALLPSDYVHDVHHRLSFYKRLASVDDEEALFGLQEELADRYGKVPEAARALIETHRLRLSAEPLGVKKIDASSDSITITFATDAPIDPARLIALIQRDRTMRLAGPEKLRIEQKTATLDARMQTLRTVLRALAP